MTREKLLLCSLLLIVSPLTFWLRGQVSSVTTRSPDALVFPSENALRLTALGYDRVLADFYWLKFVNYIGDESARKQDGYEFADKYLFLITTLDPTFIQPYWFCAFIVGAEQQQPMRANEIIQRGIDNNAGNWILPYVAGINFLLFAHNANAASNKYLEASKLPHAPSWLSRHAKLLAEKSSQQREIEIWSGIFLTAKNFVVREKARQMLMKIKSRSSTSVSK